MGNKIKFAFLGATNYSKELLLFLLENKLFPEIIFSIPKEFSISYSENKVLNVNYANLEEIADKYNIPYLEVDSVKDKRLKDYSQEIKKINLDLFLVLGWYYMVPKSIRRLAKYGSWGIHASLLPKYAGGAPLNWAIINGEKEAGVSLFRMEDGVDDGDIISQKSFEIDYKDTIKEVYEKATLASKKILSETLENMDKIIFTKQDKEKIEVYPQRSPNDGVINWKNDSFVIYNFIRALTLPYPCAYTFIKKARLKIVGGKITDIKSDGYKCGEIVKIKNKALVATMDKFIEIGLVSDEKKQYEFKDYARVNNLWGGYSRAKSIRLVA